MAGAHLALYVALPLRSLPKQINAGSGCLTPDGYWLCVKTHRRGRRCDALKLVSCDCDYQYAGNSAGNLPSLHSCMRHFGSSTYRSQDEDRRRRSAERRPGGGGASPVVRGRRMRGRGILTVALSSRIFLFLSLRPWRRRRRWWHICYFGRFVVLPTGQSEKDTRSNPY